jgi:hypothetical protein
MGNLIRWICKVPFGFWLFLVATQVFGIFTAYNHWQTAQKLLAESSDFPLKITTRMQGYADDSYRDIYIAVVALVVFLVCAVISRVKKSQATQ